MRGVALGELERLGEVAAGLSLRSPWRARALSLPPCHLPLPAPTPPLLLSAVLSVGGAVEMTEGFGSDSGIRSGRLSLRAMKRFKQTNKQTNKYLSK